MCATQPLGETPNLITLPSHVASEIEWRALNLGLGFGATANYDPYIFFQFMRQLKLRTLFGDSEHHVQN